MKKTITFLIFMLCILKTGSLVAQVLPPIINNPSLDDGFHFKIKTTSPNESFTIPTIGSGYDYMVYWGDTSTLMSYTGNATHTYATPDTYLVKLVPMILEGRNNPEVTFPFSQEIFDPSWRGFPQIYFNDTGDKDKIVSIEQWGKGKWTSFLNAFYGCSNMVNNATDRPNLAEFFGGSFSNIFNRASKFDANLGNWAISSKWVSSFTGALSYSGLSSTNYDKTLVGWSNQRRYVLANMILGAHGLKYCSAAAIAARSNLTTNDPLSTSSFKNWTIEGDEKCGEEPFVTTWETTTTNESITIPTKSTVTGYNYTVDWGDGTITNGHTGDATHTYTNSGIHTISITGGFPSFYAQPSKEKIRSIEQWGTIIWRDMSYAFSEVSNLSYNATDNPLLSEVTNMTSMFSNSSFNGDISNWDVSTITNMSTMFSNATAFNSDLSKWDVGNVTNMVVMFGGASSFNSDISGWDVSKVIHMATMFTGATRFDQMLGDWNLSSVESMFWMLDDSGLNSINYDNTLRGWAAQTSLPNGIILGAKGLNYCYGEAARTSLINDHGWNIIGDTKECAFITTYKTTTVDEYVRFWFESNDFTINWGDGTTTSGTTSNINSREHYYAKPGEYKISIASNAPSWFSVNSGYFNGGREQFVSIDQWGDLNWSSMRISFESVANLAYNATDIPNLSNVTNMSQMFYRSPTFNGDISKWDVGNVTNMSQMFTQATAFNRDLSTWNVGNVTNMSGMFRGAKSFNRDLSTWNVGNATNMSLMFSDAPIFSSDLSAWDVSNVRDMKSMFYLAKLFNSDLSTWDVSAVTDMSNMFFNAGAFNSDLSTWNVSAVTDMSNMFNSAELFNSNLSTWDVSNVTNMSGMFGGASVFNSDLSTWDVSAVTDMRYIFSNAKLFNSDLSTWDVSAVTKMNSMFQYTELFDGDLNQWDVSAVTDMSYMFSNTKLFNGDLSTWDVSAVTTMTRMFYNASSFNKDLSTWDVGNVTNMFGMFQNVTLSLENYDNLLIGWAALPSLQNGVEFSGGNSKFCNGTTPRQNIMDAYGWIITDGNQLEGCVDPLQDTDGDGVVDTDDVCPDTASGATVDANGCSDAQKDTDGDGVMDDVDTCPNTASGATVDANGCSDAQKDTDGDGVMDDEDTCPNTASGATVDATGCSDAQKDTDGDGVMDDVDTCADTPSGTPVDNVGCPASTLGIDDATLAKSISLYPNPVADILTIKSEIELTKVQFYSLIGKKVKEVTSDFNTIRIGSLSNGIYMVKIQSENAFAIKRIIINY